MKIDYWQHFQEGCFYHIYNHAVSDQNIFNHEFDYSDFLSKHYKYLSCAFDTIAYCLMPNHFHFVVKVKPFNWVLDKAKIENSNTSRRFQNGDVDVNKFILDQYRRFFSSYSLSYNFRNKRRGQLFLKRFKRVSLNSDRRLRYMICYLHHNPVHHGFTTDFSSWKHSSYKRYICDPTNDMYLDHMMNLFGSVETFYQEHEKFRLDRE